MQQQHDYDLSHYFNGIFGACRKVDCFEKLNKIGEGINKSIIIVFLLLFLQHYYCAAECAVNRTFNITRNVWCCVQSSRQDDL